MMETIKGLRSAIWHFRHGGYRQVTQWRRRVRAEAGIRSLDSARGAEGSWIGRGHRRRLVFKPMNQEGLVNRENRIKVATILDGFTEFAFGVEWECIQLRPDNWVSQLQVNRPEMLFVESAWFGPGGSWSGKIGNVDHAASALRDIVDWCKLEGIPTVFWNKEDPIHYDDFIDAARLFDWVFTTDEARARNYQEDLDHDRIGVLPFAAQPRLHNPIRPRYGWHERDIGFGGMYFASKYPERRRQMDYLLGAAVDVSPNLDTGLEIFSRQLDGADKYQFPEPLSAYVVGTLPYDQMLTAYKAYKVFLNVNTVVDSPSMCSRRVFEILASGASLVTAPSRAIEVMFDNDEVFVGENRGQTSELLRALIRNPSLADRQVHRAQRKIWEHHTYRHRADTVLKSVFPESFVPVRPVKISVLVSTNRPHRIRDVFQTVQSQVGVEIELVLLTHGFSLSGPELEMLMSEFGIVSVRYLTAPPELPLGACLNMCVRAADGDILSKMDDDDYYAPNYLRDLVHALEYSGADIVGKQAHYMNIGSIDGTLFRFPDREHRWSRTVMGPTITGRAEIFRDCPFPELSSGEDSAFLDLVSDSGYSIYSADRFNFCQRRSGDNHTWNVSDLELVTRSSIDFFGDFEGHISI